MDLKAMFDDIARKNEEAVPRALADALRARTPLHRRPRLYLNGYAPHSPTECAQARHAYAALALHDRKPTR